jgi:hypothetical protein
MLEKLDGPLLVEIINSELVLTEPPAQMGYEPKTLPRRPTRVASVS